MMKSRFQSRAKSWMSLLLVVVMLLSTAGSVGPIVPVNAEGAEAEVQAEVQEEEAGFTGTLIEESIEEPVEKPAEKPVEEPAEEPAVAAEAEADGEGVESDGEGAETEGTEVEAEAAAMLLSEPDNLSAYVSLGKKLIYINGKEYTGGEVTVPKGSSFSYEFEWSLGELPAGKKLGKGDWFEKTFFTIKGLNLPDFKKQPAIISYDKNRSIRIGTWSLTYDAGTGAYVYRMDFLEGAMIFKNIGGFKKGSGTFNSELKNQGIIIGEDASSGTIGTITVTPPPEPEEKPTSPGEAPTGTGWVPEKPPTFTDREYAFGKGKKFSTESANWTSTPYIEWRAVYLNSLQEHQKTLIDNNKDLLGEDGKGSISSDNVGNINKDNLNSSGKYYIIEDTLDVNQKFYVPNKDDNTTDSKYDSDAPFFFEIPVMIAGTGNYEYIPYSPNYSFGNGSYDGPGYFPDYITGSAFTYKEATEETYKETEKEVRNTPMSWTIIKETGVDGQNKEKLIVNIGKLGVALGDANGMAQSEGVNASITGAIDNLIKNANNKIDALEKGTNSPVAMLYNQTDEVMKKNPDAAAAVADELDAFSIWYNRNGFSSEDPKHRKASLSDKAKEELKAIGLDKALEEIEKENSAPVSSKAYQDWKLHYSKLQTNQDYYAKEYDAYLKNWHYALGRYQMTRAFYEDGRIYGFVMKYSTLATNTSAAAYHNEIRLSTTDENRYAEDTEAIKFSQGVMGIFSRGSAVFKKADSGYGTLENSGENGLGGATFRVYCDHDNKGFNQSDETLGCFADKSFSAGGDAYTWSHNKSTTEENSKLVPTEQAVIDLETDSSGTLVVAGLNDVEHHFIVETKAPEGYYLDSRPIRFKTESSEVIYEMIPNVARAVKLTKASSYNYNREKPKPVKGAVFGLYNKEKGTELTGFTKKTIIGPDKKATTFYWYDQKGGDKLATFEDGELNIHGLPAGSFYLQEKEEAPGYVLPEKPPKYEFTLAEDMAAAMKAGLYPTNPTNPEEPKKGFYYVLANPLDTPVLNHEKTKDITITKVGRGNQPLTGAAFSLLRWKGTPEQWAENPDKKEYWETVTVNAKDSVYFKTTAGVSSTSNGYFVGENGTLTFTDIPNGHYALPELEAPEGYQRADNLWHFDVDVSKDQKVQLSWNANGKNPITDNQIPNDLLPGSLKVHKVVAGNNGDLTKLFKFTIELKDAADNPITSPLNYTLTEKDANTIVEKESGPCTPKGGKYEFSLSHEQAFTLTGIPAGTKYTVSEADYPEYALVFVDDNENGTIPSHGVATVTARNRYKTGLLRLTKNVTGLGGERNRLFEFHLDFKDAKGKPLTGTYKYVGTSNDDKIDPPADGAVTLVNGSADVKLKVGQHLTFFGLPDGTKYTITEEADKKYTTKVSTNDYLVDDDGNIMGDGTEDTVVEGNEITGTIQDSRRDNVDFNNVRTPEDGALMIAKFVDSLQVVEDKKFLFHITVTDEHESPIMGTYNVEVRGTDPVTKEDTEVETTITFDSQGKADYELGHRDYLIIKGLPEKAQYEITEDSESAEGYEISIGDASKGEIKKDKAVVVIATNYHREGNLIISKEVLGRGGDMTRDFEFKLAFKDEAGKPLHGTYRYTGSSIDSGGMEDPADESGETGTIAPPADGKLELNDDGEASVILKHGQRINVSGLPENSTYQVVETAVENYETTVTDGEGTIHNKVVSNARFVNRFRTGELRVLKTVDKGDKEKPFHFTVRLDDTRVTGVYDEMEFHNGVAEFDLKDGENTMATGLPAGVAYTVEESGNEGYTVIKKGDTGVITDEEIMRAEFINTKTDTEPPTPPTDPDNPPSTNPDNPEPPTDPDTPTSPTNPDDSTPPTGSGSPNMPTDPNQPGNNTQVQGQTGTSGMDGAGMQTGDNSQAWQMLSLMMASFGVIVLILNKKKK